MKLGRAIAGLIAVTSAAAVSACAGATAPAVTAEMARDAGVLVSEHTVEPSASGWAVTGTARLLSVPGSPDLFAHVEVDGLTPGEHAWHLHTGTCDQVGSIAVPFSALGARAGTSTVLTANTEGEAEGIGPIPAAQVTRDQLMAGDYVIQIHNGGSPPGPGIACAEL